jgi:hypothetical protein
MFSTRSVVRSKKQTVVLRLHMSIFWNKGTTGTSSRFGFANDVVRLAWHILVHKLLYIFMMLYKQLIFFFFFKKGVNPLFDTEPVSHFYTIGTKDRILL